MDSDKMQTLSDSMFAFHRLYNEKVSRRVRPVHSELLTPVELLLVSIVSEREKITMSELVERAMMSKQQATKVINQLEKKKLVCRRRLDDNRRVVWLACTRQARTLLQTVYTGMSDEMAAIFGQLDDESLESYLQAVQTMNRILQLLPVGKCECPPAEKNE